MGDRWGLASAYRALGMIEQEQERHKAAGVQGTPLILEALLGMANVRAKDGDSTRAAELLSIILHHPAAAQETKLQARNLRMGLMMEGIEDTYPALEEVVRDMLASMN